MLGEATEKHGTKKAGTENEHTSQDKSVRSGYKYYENGDYIQSFFVRPREVMNLTSINMINNKNNNMSLMAFQ